MTKIDKKITGYKVKSNEDVQHYPQVTMHEKVDRPEVLQGSTYKIKTPQSEHAIYITIDDIVLDGVRHPYEVFINSKNMEHFQWIVALTRVISAVFRKGGDITFLVEELKCIFDPKGGYFKKGGVFMPSLVAEIGHVLEKHLLACGILKVDEEHAEFLASKREGIDMDKAVLCPKCNVKALVMLDGCMTCLNCGDSKCG